MKLTPKLLVTLVCLGWLVKTSSAEAYTPTQDYLTRTVQGWQIKISPELYYQHPDDYRQLARLLSQKLIEHKRVLPAWANYRLKNMTFWLEWNDPANPGGVYHPSREWLIEHGFNPDMAGCIEIGNARNFVSWASSDQPMLLLHELAHAYHHQVLSYEQPDILAAYQQAKASGKYQRVKRGTDALVQAYALTNEKEYFAESSEAFFGKNDFYPYLRNDLRDFDPTIYRLMPKLWQIN